MDSTTAIEIAILGAVFQEVEALVPLLSVPRSFTFLGHSFWTGILDHRTLLVGSTGFGKVNAAATTAALLERLSIKQVWNVGSAGAFEQSPLAVGDVLVTQGVLCGDEGILHQDGVRSTTEIGIPIAFFGNRALYDTIPLDEQGVMKAIQEMTPPGLYALQASSPRANAVDPDAGIPPSRGAGNTVDLETGGGSVERQIPPDPPLPKGGVIGEASRPKGGVIGEASSGGLSRVTLIETSTVSSEAQGNSRAATDQAEPGAGSENPGEPVCSAEMGAGIAPKVHRFPHGCFRLVYGPSLTVGMGSGDATIAAQRFLRHGAYAENMEGSAVAQTCFRFRVPVVECRGISNTAGDRNKEHWEMDKAIAHCHGIILNWLR